MISQRFRDSNSFSLKDRIKRFEKDFASNWWRVIRVYDIASTGFML